ncbi:MAG: flippase-like domain-containing protein, partial [Candidatus Binatia bacterium]
PTANLGGEPVKVYLLRTYGVSTDAGLTSVIVAKTALTVSQIVFILIGVPFFLYRLGWVHQTWWVLGLLAVAAYGFAVLLIRGQRRGLAGMAVRALRRLLPSWRRLADWQERAQRLDGSLLGFYAEDSRRFVASTVYHFLGWVLGAAEIAFFFYLMGVEVALVDALIIETMIQPVHAAALIIPGALGVQEVGGVYLCRLLGIEESAGLTLMALKRVREAVYNLIGLAVLARINRALLPHHSA